MEKITLNFKNIISEMENKQLKLCFMEGRGLFIEDNKKNFYQTEKHVYLDKLIKDAVVVEFDLVDDSISRNIMDYEKEIWGVSEVESFIKRQSKFWQ